MFTKVIIAISSVFAGTALLWALGPDSNDPVRLIKSLEGAALYKAYCAVCHGRDATGNGPMARMLRVSPPDLTRIADRNGGAFPMARVERIIAGEDPLTSGHGTREMPLWGPIFSQVGQDQDLGRVRIDNLTRYLIGIQTHTAASAR
jgi:mono/diheme cytochrome c family protein